MRRAEKAPLAKRPEREAAAQQAYSSLPAYICDGLRSAQPVWRDRQSSFYQHCAMAATEERALGGMRLLARDPEYASRKPLAKPGYIVTTAPMSTRPGVMKYKEMAQTGTYPFYRRDPNRAADNAGDSERQANSALQKVEDITDGSKEVHSEVQTAERCG